MKKLNCWEFLECGRGYTSGVNHAGREVCPAAKEKSLDGIHGGMNGGRACWAVAGKTGREHNSCGCSNSCFKRCNFYVKVRIEEGMNFKSHTFLVHMRG
jgi:hypothetical protein